MANPGDDQGSFKVKMLAIGYYMLGIYFCRAGQTLLLPKDKQAMDALK